METTGGWSLLRNIQQTFARLLGANLVVLSENISYRNSLFRFFNLISGKSKGDEIGIVLARSGADLQLLYSIPNWRRRFAFLTAYVFDSWYTEWFSIESRLFDCLFVSRLEDVGPVRKRSRRPVFCLPFGTDAMDAATCAIHGDRPIDILAYGRQPPNYSYDKLAVCTEQSGLTLQIRVPYDSDAYINQRNLFTAAGSAKYALAFCNTTQYHPDLPPKSPFITFRWVDNLAAGAVMVGKLPRPPGFEEVVGWEGAYVDLPDNVEKGMQVISDLKQSYDPKVSLRNHYESLIRNDWRVRLEKMFASMQLPMSIELINEMSKHAAYRSEIKSRLGLN